MPDLNPAAARPTRAAQYIRMSREHQSYSIEHQQAAVASYARARGFEIVRTYCDAGISGLRLDRREALKKLLSDVLGGSADFTTILTYDVSRWGRFQDPDQSAHYEFICREAGVNVVYCAEPFENDGSIISTIAKHLKRAMAAEFSRELSIKVSAAQRRLAAKGFWQGGPPGYALRRRIVDASGVPGATLEEGDWKAISSDRVVLVHGPAEEVAVVRRIFRLFLVNGLSRAGVARHLNAIGLPAEGGAAWTGSRVQQVLTNEKYMGVLAFGKTAGFLRGPRRREPPRSWSRTPDALEPIISHDLYILAQRNIAKRCRLMSDAEMLDGLRELLAEHGRLAAVLIKDAERLPCPEAYRRRFGGLTGAYAQIGYTPALRALRAGQATRRGMACARRNRPHGFSPEEMIDRLAALYARTGRLSVQVINDAAEVPGAEAYRRTFGSMASAYSLAGYPPTPKQALAMSQMTARFSEGVLVQRAGGREFPPEFPTLDEQL